MKRFFYFIAALPSCAVKIKAATFSQALAGLLQTNLASVRSPMHDHQPGILYCRSTGNSRDCSVQEKTENALF